jgi:hypothetical protein
MPAMALPSKAPDSVPTQNQACSCDMIERPASFSASAPSALIATLKQLEQTPRHSIASISHGSDGASARQGMAASSARPAYQQARRAP